jgi:hypothetical protein
LSYDIGMASVMVMQGRRITGEDLDWIRGLLVSNPGWNRTRLSRELCARWNWHNAKGHPKDMAARTLLLKGHPLRGGYLSSYRKLKKRVAPRRASGERPVSGRGSSERTGDAQFRLVAGEVNADAVGADGYPIVVNPIIAPGGKQTPRVGYRNLQTGLCTNAEPPGLLVFAVIP